MALEKRIAFKEVRNQLIPVIGHVQGIARCLGDSEKPVITEYFDQVYGTGSSKSIRFAIEYILGQSLLTTLTGYLIYLLAV